MEYTGQRRSNYFICGMIWFFFSLYILLKAVPYQLPLRPVAQLSALRLSLCFAIFIFGVLVTACLTRDVRLLRAYAVYAVLVLIVLAIRETEIERELLDKIRNYVVGYFVMPYWGWTRLIKENRADVETWIAGWCALSGAVAFFGSMLCSRKPR